MLAKALILAQRPSESLWHFVRAADLYEDDPNKVRKTSIYQYVATMHLIEVNIVPFLSRRGEN